MINRPALLSLLCLVIGVAFADWLSAEEVVSEEDSAATEHMHENLAYITAIKTYIIMGSLEGTREPANWLATHEPLPNMPKSYEPFADFMRSSARQVLQAEDLDTAAFAVSLMAQNCGNCHMASYRAVDFGFDPMPAQWSDRETHMQRYQWAMNRLWEGLIGPSDAAWNRGTTVFAVEPDAVNIPEGLTAEHAEKVRAIAAEVHELGKASEGLTSQSDRSRVYGRILGLCADCHTQVGGGPGR